MGEQLIALVVCLVIGFIGVAIVRGVPAGSFVLGMLLFVFGLALAFVGFGAALLVLYSIVRTVLGG